jgi:inward rectifier potassium channel
MAVGQSRDQIISVDSVAPEDGLQDRGYFADVYHHLLISSWPMLLLQIGAAFFVINSFFALGYYFDGGIANARAGSYLDVFFFSVETMATIGYGRMAPVTLVAHILMSLEALTGMIGLALMTGLIFSKFSRPNARVRFSRHAVISTRDGVPSLMFRMANERASQIVEAQVHVILSKEETTREGETLYRFHDLQLTRYRNATFRHSWTVVHPITPSSPLHGQTAESLKRAVAEIVVSVTGIEGAFMQTVYARHIYAAADIVWGARLSDMMIRSPQDEFFIDYGKFDSIEEVAIAISATREG